jgi:7,8-dihydropterin-6-yl-methyl-4-(beta-D-ribofuranosyl)aminobenzene 5'-phosphate synthase
LGIEETHVHAVIGGVHLVSAFDTRIERTIDALKELDIDLIAPCHCTEATAVAALRGTLDERIHPGTSGMSFTFAL